MWIVCVATYQKYSISFPHTNRAPSHKQKSTNCKQAPIKPHTRSHTHPESRVRSISNCKLLAPVIFSRTTLAGVSRVLILSSSTLSASPPPTRLAFASLLGRDPRLHISAQLHRVNISDNELCSAARYRIWCAPGPNETSPEGPRRAARCSSLR